MRSRPVILGLLLVLTLSLAGCNAKDWYNQRGTLRVEVEVYADESVPADLPVDGRLSDFQSLRLTFRDAQVRQLFVANPLTSPSKSDLYDAVALSKGGTVRLMDEKVNLRGLEQVVVRLAAIDGVTAAGQTIPGCERGDRVEEPPCIRFDRGGAYVSELNPDEFRVPRGGTLTIVFPIGIGYNEEVNEYFVFRGVPRAVTD